MFGPMLQSKLCGRHTQEEHVPWPAQEKKKSETLFEKQQKQQQKQSKRKCGHG
jgi:hypothetical protein